LFGSSVPVLKSLIPTPTTKTTTTDPFVVQADANMALLQLLTIVLGSIAGIMMLSGSWLGVRTHRLSLVADKSAPPSCWQRLDILFVERHDVDFSVVNFRTSGRSAIGGVMSLTCVLVVLCVGSLLGYIQLLFMYFTPLNQHVEFSFSMPHSSVFTRCTSSGVLTFVCTRLCDEC
jgi:hypothetical protein